jgi:hypothetical protein
MMPSVTKDEGLRSPKAIAFIQRNCSRKQRLKKKTYSTVRFALKKANEILKKPNQTDSSLKVPLMKNLGDKTWIK